VLTEDLGADRSDFDVGQKVRHQMTLFDESVCKYRAVTDLTWSPKVSTPSRSLSSMTGRGVTFAHTRACCRFLLTYLARRRTWT
jgi:hypothetical protein